MKKKSDPTIAFFAGSFNPFTPGHRDIALRALALFDKLIIGIGYNINKPYADLAVRIEHIKKEFEGNTDVSVIAYNGLTTDAAREAGACALVRGVRSMSDFEYEMTMADVNRRLSGIETVLLPARPELACMSSSIVRELEKYGRKL